MLEKNVVYENFLNERQILLDKVKNKEKIEKSIKKQLKKNMGAHQNHYFKLEALLKIPEVEKHFRFFVITGDRNIGKTTALKNFLKDKYDNESSEFIWLRNLQTEIDHLLPQIEQDWFKQYGWKYRKTAGIVYKSEDAMKAKDSDNIVGYFKGLSNSANLKSVEFNKVNYVVYDEFNNTTMIKEKYKKLITLLTTIERQKKMFKVILTANYISQNDEILMVLGLEQKKKQKQPLLVFNWISRTIIWNIPKGFYCGSLINSSLGYSLSLNDFDTYQTQYAGTFANEYKTNIKAIEKMKNKQLIFNIAIGKTIYSAFSDGQEIIVCNDEKYLQKKNVPLYAFDKESKFKHLGAELFSGRYIKWLINLWEQDKLLCDALSIADKFIFHLSKIQLDEKRLVNIIK